MSVGWYFARRVALWFGGVALVAAALLWALSALLPEGAVRCSPWSLFAPLFLCATAITWSRAWRHGEMLAAAAAGIPAWSRAVPVLCVGVLLQVVFAMPAGRSPDTSPPDTSPDTSPRVHRGMSGDLVLLQAVRRVQLTAAGEVLLGPPSLPRHFRSAPTNPDRYRRQAFFTSPPRFSAVDPLDPSVWRWVYALLACLVPVGLMFSKRASSWWLACLPFLVPFALVLG